MMELADAKRLKALEKEYAEFKKMYADAMLRMKISQETIEKELKGRRNDRILRGWLFPRSDAVGAKRRPIFVVIY